MEARWTLQHSMGRALEIANLEDVEKLDEEKDKSLSDIVTAIEMIKAGETTMRKFQIKHARAVLVLVFDINLKKSASKKDLLEELAAQMLKDPEKVKEYNATITTAASGVAAMQRNNRSSDTEGEEESVAALLLKACLEEVKLGDYLVSALELSLLILDVVREIESTGEYDSDDNNGDISFVQYMFNAFSKKVVTKRNMDFVYSMSDRVPTMINANDLSKEELRRVFKEHLDSQQ